MFNSKQQRHLTAAEKAKRDPTSIGNILLNEMNAITIEQLEKALDVQRSEAQLGEIMLAMGMVSKEILNEALMKQRLARGETKSMEVANYMLKQSQLATNEVGGSIARLNSVIHLGLASGRIQTAKTKR